MEEFTLSSKVVWRRSVEGSIETAFYPSFYKSIEKRLPNFQQNFEFQFVPANVEGLKKHFLPLYEQEVMSRESFLLDRETIRSELIEKVTTKNHYHFLFVFYQGQLALATLFAQRDGGIFVGYRAVKKDVDAKLRHDATVAYWGEKLLFEYAREQKVGFISRGKDTHPYWSKANIGRPLYKLKTGVKPRAPYKDGPQLILLEEKIIFKEKKPVLFFTEPSSEGFYQKGFLYYPKDLLSDSYVNEFVKVFEWAHISFVSKTY